MRLPDTWTSVALKDLGTWHGGGTPSKARVDFWSGGSVPWLSPKDMGPEVVHQTQDLITQAAIAGSSVRLVPAGSVAVVVRSGILERTIPIALVPMMTTLNQDMKAVVPRDDIDPRWIAWGLRSKERQLMDRCRKAGTTVASIDTKRFMAEALPVPPIEEQRRILDLLEDHLSRLDAASKCLSDGLRRARSLEQSVLASIYSEGQSVRTLAEVSAIQGGIQKQPKRAPVSSRYPFLRVANVTSRGLDLRDVHEVELFDGELERLRLFSGDLLVVEGNGSPSQIGRAALWDGSIADCVHQNHLIRVRATEGLLPGYLEAIWNAPQHRRRLSDVSSSSSGLHTLSVAKLKALPIPIPPRDRQQQAMGRVREMRRARERLEADLTNASAHGANLRRSLLSAAFAGRLTA